MTVLELIGILNTIPNPDEAIIMMEQRSTDLDSLGAALDIVKVKTDMSYPKNAAACGYVYLVGGN